MTEREAMEPRRGHERPMCGARTRAGSVCRNRPASGRTRCSLHGGNAKIGFASPNHKHGRYSKHLPMRLLTNYRTSLRDDDALTLREQIALLDTRIADLLDRVDTGESAAVWRDLRGLYRALQRFNRDGDLQSARIAMADLGDLITRGASDSGVWHELYGVFERRRHLVDSERKRLIEMEQLISVDRTLAFVSTLIDVVQQHVSDPDTLTAIAAGLAQLLDHGGRRPALAGGGPFDGPPATEPFDPDGEPG